MVGKQAVRLKEVVYSLGTYNQTIMSGLWADLPYKISKKVKENWLSTLCLVGPVVGTYTYASAYKEKEKLHHRF